MVEVWISNECHQLVMKTVLDPAFKDALKNEAVPAENGGWVITIREDTADRLADNQKDDETLSDTLFRIMTFYVKRGLN